ncbi:hypothetical protein [Gordonia sp. HS-NH1]|uniref:hypothetical protein n=1 Tax=Gordonia sp. HS-NH1 TaxID=1435068 RepID=UPI0006E2E770|nr:hypothetical protein [Gordonia sp. HS-NH1]
MLDTSAVHPDAIRDVAALTNALRLGDTPPDELLQADPGRLLMGALALLLTIRGEAGDDPAAVLTARAEEYARLAEGGTQ